MKLKKGTLLFLLLTCLAYTTLAQEVDNKLDGNDVTIDDKGIITGCKDAFSKTSIIIPEKIGETTITGIGDNWPGIFKDKNLVSVAFASDSKVTTIGYNAFRGNQITELTLPTPLTTIGDNAFQGNDSEDAGGNNITTLTLPPSLTVIGDSAFYNNSLTTVIFNDDPNKSKIKYIEKDAFSGNTGLTGIALPNHATGVDVTYKDSEGNDYDPNDDNKNTFTNFDRSLVAVIPTHTLTADDVTVENGIITKCHCGNFVSNSIEIPVQIGGKPIRGIADKSWPDGVFKNKNLIAVAFEEGSQITSIGDYAFYDNQITELTFPDDSQLERIGSRAFYGNKITELTLPTVLKTIGGLAFINNKITELTFPDDSQLTTIGSRAFANNPLPYFTLPSVTKERFRTYWQDESLADLGANLTIPEADFGKSFELVSIEQVTLTLTISGVGLVEGLKAGKNPVDKGQSLTLTAKPNGGNELEKWVFGSDISTSTSTYTIPAEETQNDLSIEVHFKEKDISDPVELTISTDGQGTVTPNIGINTYKKGTMVDLTATPDEGWRFDKWVIGSNEISNNHTNVTVDADTTATAHFVQLVKLTLATIGEGSINPSVEPNEGVYDIKTEVTLTATHQDGWKFDKWVITGGEDENGNPITVTVDDVDHVDVTVDADKTATAHFVEAVILTLIIQGLGQVQGLEAGENLVDKGQSLTLTAKPADDWRFDKWVITGGEDEDGDPITVTVDDVDHVEVTADADKTATAHFVEQVTLTLTIQGLGQVQGLEAGENLVDKGQEFTITATPNEGHEFEKWVFEGSNISTSTSTIPADKTQDNLSIEVYFEKKSFNDPVELTINIVGQGTVTPNTDINTYERGSGVDLTATPADGWKFDKWVISDEENKTDKTTTITLDQDKTVTAHFVEAVTLTLTIIEETGASNVVSGLNAGKNKIDKGADFELKATPASGQKFVSWTIDGKTIDYNPHTLTTTETNISITVTFEAIPQQVTLTLVIEGKGSINPSIEPNSVDPDNEMKGMYDINTEIELTAKPNDGWKFDKWEISDEEDKIDETTTITLDKNKSVTAHFVEGEEEEAITSILTEVVSATPYPNPVTSQITLKAKDGDLIQLFSPKGKQQYSAQHTGNEVHTIDVSTLPVGVYLVRITDAEGNTTTKRIVKK